MSVSPDESAPERAALAARAQRLQAVLPAAGAERLRRSVLRPLGQVVAEAEPDDDGPVEEQLWDLARQATQLCLSPGAPPELLEATAELQAMVAEERLAELREMQAHLPAQIRAARNGPYLLTNAERLTDWLGRPLPTRPQMALCRCGGSAMKPFCDGTHAEIGFTDDKDPKRVPDRRDTFVGQQVTIFDNRGICQHAGYCSDRLATVFRIGEEPFVAPSGGRMDEIVRAVRDCPSGALSYAVDGHEARQQVDHGGTREPSIEVSKDGPYRITGGRRGRRHRPGRGQRRLSGRRVHCGDGAVRVGQDDAAAVRGPARSTDLRAGVARSDGPGMPPTSPPHTI